MDKYSAVRSLSFAVTASILDINTKAYRRSKDEWVGGCPIHQSKSNKTCFRYNDDGKFHCFSCSAKGRGPIDLAMAVKGLSFKAAVELLSPFVDSQPSPAKEKAPIEAVSAEEVLRPLDKDTWRKFAIPCPWLEHRVPDTAVRELYGVFCYNNPARKSVYSGRVMLPIRDVEGCNYGYLGRAVESTDSIPKYLFPRNLPKSRFLFGADVLKAGKFGQVPLKRLYLVESPFCVMKLAAMGLPAVSPFGWSVSPEQIALLQKLAKGIVYLPDRNKSLDCAGVVKSLAQGLWLRFPPLPAGIDDPEQMTREVILAL